MPDTTPCDVLGGFLLISPPHDENAIASMIAHVVHCQRCASSPSGQAFLAEFHIND